MLVQQAEDFQNEQYDEFKLKKLEYETSGIEKLKKFNIEDDQVRKKRQEYENKIQKVKDSLDPNDTENLRKIQGKGD